MSNQFGDTRIDDDLTLLSETLEEVLRSSGDPADQKYVELKARAEKALESGGSCAFTNILWEILFHQCDRYFLRSWYHTHWDGTRGNSGVINNPCL